MKRLILVAFVLMATCSGCMFAKRGFKEVLGASGKVLEVNAPSLSTLRAHPVIRGGEVTNEIGALAPSGMVQGLKTYLTADLSGEFSGTTPPLTVDLAVQYAQAGGSLKKALGSDQYLVSRAVLRNPEKEQVGELVVVSHSEAMRTSGEDMAKASIKALIDYFKSKVGEDKKE